MTAVMLWTRPDPFAQVDALVRNMFTVPAQRATTPAAGFVPAVEVVRDGGDALVRIELPGLDVDKDVTVEVDGDRLTVGGERRAEAAGAHGLREIRYGSFRRSFALPRYVTADAVSAEYTAGVLTVRIGGAYVNRQARAIPVRAGAPAEVGADRPGSPGPGPDAAPATADAARATADAATEVPVTGDPRTPAA